MTASRGRLFARFAGIWEMLWPQSGERSSINRHGDPEERSGYFALRETPTYS